MEKLDRLVSEKLAERLLTPERVAKLLDGPLQRQSTRDEDYAKRLAALEAKLNSAETKLRRLYDAIEAGVADPSDPTLKDRLTAAKQDRDIAQASLDRARAELHPSSKITPDKIAAFAKVMRSNVLKARLRSGAPTFGPSLIRLRWTTTKSESSGERAFWNGSS